MGFVADVLWMKWVKVVSWAKVGSRNLAGLKRGKSNGELEEMRLEMSKVENFSVICLTTNCRYFWW